MDTSLARRIAITASVAGALGVAIGAFGAHALPEWLAERGLDEARIAKRSDQFDVAARYHLVHAAALLAVAALPTGSPRGRRTVAWLLTAGIILFSGSLYVLVIADTPWLGAITPLGGLAWIAGWVALAVTSFRAK